VEYSTKFAAKIESVT